jgi:hypothetical protein
MPSHSCRSKRNAPSRAQSGKGFVAAALALLLLTNCSSEPKLPPNAPKPGERVTLQDVSFLPPQEPGWLLEQDDPQHRLYGRAGRDRDHNYFAEIAVSPLPVEAAGGEKLLAWVKRTRLASDRKQRRMVEADSDWDSNRKARCVRYKSIVQDYTAKNSVRAPYVLVTTYGLACQHPKDAALLVEATLTEHGLPEDVLPDIAEKMANGFLKEVRF